ncbi:C45 family autoproteolytic acyltransferase/hydrolase [Lentisphaera profundi]|uniref:C45 family autoproteolytic acyltransferase/hydrolase n=1 Tax=Lentisphaera profundi TaxID=1658616 RepID=A0ABY7VSG8_9BACT|nr:C45 family peptidase [Lentisphaera profundi]WDE96992.1 C45 family autoproteolytic acyltransferase/hydrolase [Lentisphaera profundi]
MKIIFLLMAYSYLSVCAFADKALFDAYEEFTQVKAEDFTRKISYDFKPHKGDSISGDLSYLSKGENRFSLSFTLGLMKIILTRDDNRIQFYIPHNKTLFTSSAGEKSFSLNAIMSSLEMMDSKMAMDIKSLLSLRDLTENYKLIISDNSSIYYIYASGRLLAEISLAKERLDKAKLFFKTGVMNLSFSSSKTSYLIYRNSRAKKIKKLGQDDMSRSLTRALARYIQIRYHELLAKKKEDIYKVGKYGNLRSYQGLNLVYLKGSAYEIGWQHGQFLAKESRKVVDSTLYLMGMVYTIKTGDWFMNKIREAQRSLDQHTPPEYIEELRGLADGSGIAYEELHLANYFPALFHCSGFTVKDDKTLDGVLYHGRVLDYMCRIGLQYENAVFSVEKTGKIPFVNVGFAGFIGSVSGMNQSKISLGEMGGAGEGLWDGVPMPILMRMALEEGKDLNQVKAIFKDNRRTCEYYYIFADGKDRSSTAVYATPESIEFLDPGMKHEKLPHEVPKCLMIASGSRYESLHNKVKVTSQIDEEKAIDLMNAPTASIKNNLHSVLFVPEKLKLWISYAGIYTGAYDEVFIDLKLSDLLDPEFYELAE